MERQESAAELIRLSGVAFRESPIQCPCCHWSGLAGQLRMAARNSARDASACYACPACESTIAMHVGLTDQEVLQEMERIRRELAEELKITKPSAGERVGKRFRGINFQAVRRQIAVAEPEPAAAEVETELAGNGRSIESNSGNVEQVKKKPRAVPDFESVRSRLLFE